MLAMLNAKKRLVGHANLFGKLCIRKVAPCLAEELCQLLIQIALHAKKVAKMLSRMRDDFCFTEVNKAMKLMHRIGYG